MRELELRLALVCYGGASLAVYMNGISHEILKLVRASRAYQSAEGGRDTFEQAAPRRPYATDSEDLYFELFKILGKKIDLRVIVDVVSGASAGGINGIFLSRALAHDLDFDPLRNLWMELGDIEELMDQKTIANRTSKFFMYPLIWIASNRIFGSENLDSESKRKLSRFLRSRWFEPPFSGERMLSWMINACSSMGAADGTATLMPKGHKLDLFVSLTNFFGQTRRLKLHDPKEISERQHKITMNFSYQDAEGQESTSDMADDNIAGLGFAARATSSFPGAFPPVTLRDVENYLAKVRRGWPDKKAFLAKNFPNHVADPDALETMSFIDGGVTNNKPFAEAINATQARAAHREVDRRIIYVDPLPDDPAETEGTGPTEKPGWFHTILSSLAEIPRSDPIYGDLRAIEESNKEARRLESVFETIEADVRLLVDNMLDLESDRRVETAMLAGWRERAHRLAQEKSGFAYGTYIQSKIQQLLERLTSLLVSLARHEGHNLNYADTRALVDTWAADQQILGLVSDHAYADLLSYVNFLSRYDVDFRVRRLRFTVKRLNHFLQHHKEGTPTAFYKLTKREIYKRLEEYRARWQVETFTEGLLDVWPDKSELSADTIGPALRKIGDLMMLEDIDYITDEFMAMTLSSLRDRDLKVTLFRAYVGYAFYDVLTQPMTARTDLLEVDEIRVDRISPLDCGHLADGKNPLKGTELFNFGAFFSRGTRENDYLWGRIHASNRMVDFMLDAAGVENLPEGFDASAFKCRLINKILDSEEENMEMSADLIKELRAKFA